MKDSLQYYDADFDIGWKEKKTIELKADDLHPVSINRHIMPVIAVADSVVNDSVVNDSTVNDSITNDSVARASVIIKAPVIITAQDDFTSIWINR